MGLSEVDLRPDGVLRSIYSDKTFTAEELIRADAGVERVRTERLLEFTVSETALGPSELRAEAAAIEAALPYNCERVVPQSWFGEDEPMRGEIHHLFACEVGCNSFRGNFPYCDFLDTLAAVRDACGRLEDDGFATIYAKAVKRRSKLSSVYLAEFDRALAWAALPAGEWAAMGSETEIEVRGLTELPSDLA